MVESRFWKSAEHTFTTVFVSMEDHDRTTVSLSYGKALKAARGRGENAKGKLIVDSLVILIHLFNFFNFIFRPTANSKRLSSLKKLSPFIIFCRLHLQ